MDLIIKVTEDFTIGVTEIYTPLSLSFINKLFGSNTLKFEIFTRDEKLKQIKQFQKIEVLYFIDGVEYSIWNGYISKLHVKLPRTEITCMCGRELLKHKMNFSQKSFTTETPQNIVQDLIDDSNARDPIKGTLTVLTNIVTPTTVTFAEGSNYNASIEALSKLVSGQWKVDKNEIILRDRLGEDRLISPNFIEIVSSITTPNINTLADVDVTFDSKVITTNIKGKNNNGTTTRTNNITEFGSVENYKTFEDGDIVPQIDSYIASHSVSQRKYKINIDNRSIDLLDVYVGDAVWLRVEQDIELIDTFEPYIITEKKITFEFGQPKMQLKLSNNDIEEYNLGGVISQMSDSIRNIQNVI